jgi:hypothetical protein
MHRLRFDIDQNAEKCKQQAKMHQKKNYRQSLNKFFLSSSGRLLKIQVVHYFDNFKGKFFFEAKISTVWLQIKLKNYRQVEGATCQCQTGACAFMIEQNFEISSNMAKIGREL